MRATHTNLFLDIHTSVLYSIGKESVMRLRTSHGGSPICGEASPFYIREVITYAVQSKTF